MKLDRGRHHRLREMKELARLLVVPSDERPCIAFRIQPPWKPFPKLQIKLRWYSTPEGRRAFSKAIQQWLSGPDLSGMLRLGVTNEGLARRLTDQLKGLEARIDHAVRTSRSEGEHSFPGKYRETRQSSQAHCEAIVNGELRPLTRGQYQSLVRKKAKFALFIDGMTMMVTRRTKKKRDEELANRLTASEIGFLWDLISSGRNLTARQTPTGKMLGSVESAERTLRSALAKADPIVSGGKRLLFTVHRKSDWEPSTSYQFCPLPSQKICIIRPLGPPRSE